MSDSNQVANTDRELWRGPDDGGGSYYADSIHITEGGGVGIDVGGHVVVKPLRDWHALASLATETPSALRTTLEDIIAVYEWCSVDPIDRGYSSLDNEISRAKHLLNDPVSRSGSK